MSTLIALFLGGIIPWWTALLGVLAGVWLQKSSWPKRVVEDPEVLPVPWHDFYSSHDPVPNGPIDVVPVPDWTDKSDSDVAEFYSRQCEVVNRRSILGDHTSYWSSPDDFVAGVADILANASKMPIHFTLDKDWLKVSTNRRLWRVTWLSWCRAVAGLASLAVILWPRYMLKSIGSNVRELTLHAAAKLPAILTAWIPSSTVVPDWLLGAGGLALATYLGFLVAFASWSMWEKQELTRFFQREPHPSVGVAGWLFALGWFGILVLAPAYALAHTHPYWKDILAVLWAPCTLAMWTAWAMYKSGHGPATPVQWGRIALAHAEKVIDNKEQDRVESLREAMICFALGHKYLGMKHFGSDEWVRAVLGETRAIEELTKSELSHPL